VSRSMRHRGFERDLDRRGARPGFCCRSIVDADDNQEFKGITTPMWYP
jgi:hypothetical protein